MKLPKSIKVVDTKSLFMNKYNYKIVVVCPAAAWFRGKDPDFTELKLKDAKENPSNLYSLRFKTTVDFNYSLKLCNLTRSFSDYDIRIEHPIINFYTNDEKILKKIVSLDESRIKYVSIPNTNAPKLKENAVILKRLDFDYRVHVGKTSKSHLDFINWSENNKNLRLTKRLIKDLSRDRSWGGGYFYVKGAKNLTMVQMFLGSEISKIDNVIKG
jgi:hypothetical protein